MNSVQLHSALIGVGLVVCAACSAAGQVIDNGDFSRVVPRNGTGNGWTSSHIDSIGGWYTETYRLNDNGNGGTDPTLAQLITGLSIGSVYQISGDYASWYQNQNPPGGPTLSVQMDGLEIFLGTTTPGQVWTPFAGTFTATATDMLLELKAEVYQSDNDCAVDNIWITLVPAPGTAGMLGLLALMGGIRRRRQA